ncbi:hypothetical protein [Halobacterium hubeiense]|uniref:hypothetical protein n=1 Tax=Halobacterium hubeiense TaxID=1407499 RepID=UPI003C727012
MYKIPRDKIDRPKAGDIFTIQTATKRKMDHQAPDYENAFGVPAENTFEGPYWAFVKGGETDEELWVRLSGIRTSYMQCQGLVERDWDEGYVYRPDENTNKAVRGSQRTEKIKWDGTPQSRIESNYSEIMNEGDIRGDKNDLLNGHL